MEITRLVVYYLIGVNLLTFIAYGIDKYKARHKQWRITEASLLLLAILGGSPAALLAMRFFHHKTLHKKIRYGVPAILLIQLTIVIFLIVKP